MKQKRSWFFSMSLVAGLVSSALIASSAVAEIRNHSFRLASVQAADHPFCQGGQKFADLITEKSGGKMKAKLFAGGSLGGDAQIVSSLQGGTIDGTFVSTGFIAPMDTNFGIFYMPMAFNNTKEADMVADGPFGKKLLERLDKFGLVGLTYWEHGFRPVTNNKHPITKLEDFQGLKLRTITSPIFVDIYKQLGANPVPMGFTELFTALEQKAVDGQETGINSMKSARFDEVQKYLSLTNIVYDPLVVLFSKKTWEKLNADERKIITEAALEATDFERKLSRSAEAEVIKNLPTKSGMAVNELSEAERQRIRKVLQPVVDKYSKDYDPALLAEFWAEVEKARKATAK